MKVKQKGIRANILKNSINNNGGKFLFVNWGKDTVHYLTPTGVKLVMTIPEYVKR